MSNARVNRMFMEEPAAESETTTEEDMYGKPILLGKGNDEYFKRDYKFNRLAIVNKSKYHIR